MIIYVTKIKKKHFSKRTTHRILLLPLHRVAFTAFMRKDSCGDHDFVSGNLETAEATKVLFKVDFKIKIEFNFSPIEFFS